MYIRIYMSLSLYLSICLSLYLSLSLYIHIYIHIHTYPVRSSRLRRRPPCQIRRGVTRCTTPNLPTNIVDFGGFDSSIILILRGGILRPIRDVPESLTQAIIVGMMSVGGLGVLQPLPDATWRDTMHYTTRQCTAHLSLSLTLSLYIYIHIYK